MFILVQVEAETAVYPSTLPPRNDQTKLMGRQSSPTDQVWQAIAA